MFFNQTNVNSVSIKKYPGKAAGVRFSIDFFLYQKDKDLITLENPPIINIYITHKTLAKTLNSEFTLKNCLFGAVKITNKSNSDKDMWQYNVYGIAFDSKGEFTHPSGQGYTKNVVIFGVDSSCSRHSFNKTQNILVLGKEFIQKINNTTIYAEKMYLPNFTLDDKIFCLSLHYNSDNSYLFVNGKEICKFKTKSSELKKYNLCLGSISKDHDKKDVSDIGLNGLVYDFSVDNSPITTDKILDIHKYLLKKNNIK